MRSNRLLATALGTVMLLGAGGAAAVPAMAATARHGDHAEHDAHDTHTSRGSTKPSTEAFDEAMRKLWEDHITWTRLFIVSASANLPDLEATTNRLLQNQADIGNAIKPYYGDEAGAALTGLLRSHILGAADLLTAAKTGDDTAVQQAKDAWYANGDQIATFLSKANPTHWASADMKAMMRSHLDLTLEEAVAHLQGRFTDDVAAYDKVHEEILTMADMLSSGIEQQFPNRFA